VVPSAPTQKRTVFASLGALAAALSAMTCCLPVIPLALAATSAGAGAFLATLRPWLLIVAVLLIAYGFFEAWRAKRCQRRQAVAATALLWTSAILVSVVLLVPDLLANFLAR
jgi:hypothetical protein